jgi:hypothetical protein
MRAVDCPKDGEYLEGSNDTELLEAAKRHNQEEHPDEYSEADLRILVNTAAYDAGREVTA